MPTSPPNPQPERTYLLQPADGENENTVRFTCPLCNHLYPLRVLPGQDAAAVQLTHHCRT